MNYLYHISNDQYYIYIIIYIFIKESKMKLMINNLVHKIGLMQSRVLLCRPKSLEILQKLIKLLPEPSLKLF